MVAGLVLLQLLLVVLVLFSDSFQVEENPRFSTLDESLVAFFEIADQDTSVKVREATLSGKSVVIPLMRIRLTLP